MQKEWLMEVRNLGFSYEEGRPVLKDINFGIRQGERIAVVGANGAGKSTLFFNMNGVLSPDSGEVFWKGEKVGEKDWKRLREKVGIVFQNADEQIIASTVLSEVAFGPVNQRLPGEMIQKQTREAIRYMGLQGMEQRPPHDLSGGEKKRVSIADILAMKPEIFIFDEPTAALDPFHIRNLEETFDRLSMEGKTILVSTHDVDFAYRFAQRILVFAHGCLIADDRPESVFENENLRNEARIEKPTLLEISEYLFQKGWIDHKIYPKTMDELKEMV